MAKKRVRKKSARDAFENHPKGWSVPLSFKGPRPAHDLRMMLIPSVSQRTGSQQFGFETRADMRVEARRRARGLNQLPKLWAKTPSKLREAREAARLSKQLKRVMAAKDLRSFANPFFARKIRLRLFGELIRLCAKAEDEARIYHIVSAKWSFPAARLNHFKPRKLIQSLRSNLTAAGRLGTRSGWSVVFLHVDYDGRTDRYNPHYHVLVVGEKYQAFEALRKLKLFKGGRESEVYFPIKIQRVDDPARQISYLLKSYWPGKTSSPQNASSTSRAAPGRSRRMQEPRHSESILFLHRLGFSDLVWIHGVVVRKGRLKLTGKDESNSQSEESEVP